MIYSKQKGFIFFHTPKTAGTSLNEALIKYHDLNFEIKSHGFNQHIKPQNLFPLIAPSDQENMFKLSFVRNPYDRLVSLYRFIKGDKSHPTYPFIKSANCYKDWLFNYYPHSKDRQYNWTHDDNERLIVDHIAKFENLQNEIKFLEEKLQLNINIGWKNKSHFDDSAYNDAECINFINTLLDKEFQLLNYKKK